MKFFDLKVLNEALASNQIDVNQWSNYTSLPLIRFIDYVKVGIDEDFTHTGTQVGGADKAASRKKNVGSRDTHKDNCMACVNDMLTTKGHQAFGKTLSQSKSTVPKIPAEFKAEGEDDFEKEIDFLVSCDAVAANAGDTFKLTSGRNGRSSSTLFANEVEGSPIFDKYSLMIAYSLESNALVANVNGSTTIVELKNPPLVNYDSEAKYLDPEIDTPEREAKSLQLIKTILAATEKDLPNESNGDLRNKLADFKAKIPADGKVFLSPNEIEPFTGLLETFKKSPEERKKTDSVLATILSSSIEEMKNGEKIDFANAPEVKDEILKGGYDLYVGFADETDPSHHSSFGVSGKENVYVGYITNYPNQVNRKVIPVYFVTSSETDKKELNRAKFNRFHIDELGGTADFGYDKLNTGNSIKRMGDGTLIYQIPSEIWRKMKPATSETAKAANVDAATSTNKKTPSGKKATAQIPMEFEPTNDPVVSPVEPASNPQAPEAPAPITAEDSSKLIDAVKAQYQAGTLNKQDAIKEALKIKADHGMKISDAAVKKLVTAPADSTEPKPTDISKREGGQLEPAEVSNTAPAPAPIAKKAATSAPKTTATKAATSNTKAPMDFKAIKTNKLINTLLDPKVAKLSDAALHTVSEIYANGGILSNEQIDTLVSKGISRDKLMPIVKKSIVTESRNGRFFNLGSILESLQKRK